MGKISSIDSDVSRLKKRQEEGNKIMSDSLDAIVQNQHYLQGHIGKNKELLEGLDTKLSLYGNELHRRIASLFSRLFEKIGVDAKKSHSNSAIHVNSIDSHQAFVDLIQDAVEGNGEIGFKVKGESRSMNLKEYLLCGYKVKKAESSVLPNRKFHEE